MSDAESPLAPMKASTGPLPEGPGWAYELKWDGMRAIVRVEAAKVTAHSSRLNDITVSFPELTALAEAVALDVVLDGELVALEDGRPSFTRLQQRIHLTNPIDVARRAEAVPIVYVVFDLLSVGEDSTVGLPYRDRRRLLEQVLPPRGPGWRLTDVHYDGGPDLLAAAAEKGLEGVVAKRLGSRYEPGRRSANWVKAKVRRHQELVVGGWISGEGNSRRAVASLMVGYHDEHGLRYAGSVGSGLNRDALARLTQRLEDLAGDESPFVDPVPSSAPRAVHFVRPEIVVEVGYSEWTSAGRLRHAVFLGERTDVDPDTVTREI